MRLILDRIEEGIAVFENHETRALSKLNASELPPNAKEGNVYRYDEETQRLEFDEDETEKRKQKIRDLSKQLFV